MKTKLTTLLLFVICICSLTTYADTNADLAIACKAGDLEGVKKAIAAGAQVNALDAAGNPAISGAFFWPEIVKYLLENKADPNLGNITVLYQACFYSSADVIKLVLDAGADPNKVCKSDASSGLRTMIENEKKKGKGADKKSIKIWEGAVALLPYEVYALPYLIANSNCVPCLQMMLDKGAKVELGVTDGSLLHTFASSGASREYRKSVFVTIKPSIEPYGFKVPDWYVNMSDERNGTPDAILKLLLSKGLNINEKNKGAGGIPPQTPLEVALGSGFGNKEEVTLALVNNGADVKTEGKWAGPVILQAAQCGFAQVLKAMVEKGADINTEGPSSTYAGDGSLSKDFTPLTAAAAKDRLEAVKFLIDKGAKKDGISATVVSGTCPGNLKNKSAIYFAIENGNLEMVKYIVEHNGFNKKNISLSAKKMTGCIGGGSYSPSEYAAGLGKTEISAYLKNQKL